MSATAPDPGGIFQSDYQRRVAAHLPVPSDDPKSTAALLMRIEEDTASFITDEAELTLLLEGLEGGGYAKKTVAGWRLTSKGLSALDGPIDNEPDALAGDALKKAEIANKEHEESERALEATTRNERVAELREQLEAAEEEAQNA